MSSKEYHKEYYQKNKDKLLNHSKEYYHLNKDKVKEYYNTPIVKAKLLVRAYNATDEKHNRGKGDLTAQWIVDNIFSKQCVHCGESDWMKIGCNRIDNSKPHTMDNVEPCCWKCNCKFNVDSKKKQVYQYTLEGELVAVYESAADAARQTGLNQKSISEVCRSKRSTNKGYKWSYEPL